MPAHTSLMFGLAGDYEVIGIECGTVKASARKETSLRGSFQHSGGSERVIESPTVDQQKFSATTPPFGLGPEVAIGRNPSVRYQHVERGLSISMLTRVHQKAIVQPVSCSSFAFNVDRAD